MAKKNLSVSFKVSRLDVFFLKAGVVCRMAMRQSDEEILEWVKLRASDMLKVTGPTSCKH